MKKVAAPPPFYIPGCFIQQTYIRLYKSETSASEVEAKSAFDREVQIKNVIFVRKIGLRGDVSVYQFKE